MKKTVILFFMLSIVVFGEWFGTDSEEKIAIIHTDAMKATVLPKEKNGEMTGGFSLLKSTINYFKEKNKNTEFIILDAGSSTNGSVFSFYSQGKAISELFNNLGYDAVNIDNREFDYGISYIEEMKKEAKFEMLSSNIYLKNGKRLFKDYFIKTTKKGTRVAVVGLTYEKTDEVALKDLIENYEFRSADSVLTQLLPKLRNEADIVVLLSGLREERDIEIAKKYKGKIDVIIGRTNTYEYKGEPLTENGTDIVKTEGKSYSAGCYTITFNKKKGIVKKEWENKKVSSKAFMPDSETGSIIKKYSEKIDSILLEKVGESKRGLNSNDKNEESETGNFITDALYNSIKCDFAVINSGGVREGFGKIITKGDIYRAFPFQNQACLTTLKGSDIKILCERSISTEKGPLFFSGLTFTYDSRKTKMERVIKIIVKGRELDENKYYKVATLDFLMEGGDGYIEFKNGKDTKHINNARAVITEYISKNSPVDAKIEGRFKDIAKEETKK